MISYPKNPNKPTSVPVTYIPPDLCDSRSWRHTVVILTSGHRLIGWEKKITLLHATSWVLYSPTRLSSFQSWLVKYLTNVLRHTLTDPPRHWISSKAKPNRLNLVVYVWSNLEPPFNETKKTQKPTSTCLSPDITRLRLEWSTSSSWTPQPIFSLGELN